MLPINLGLAVKAEGFILQLVLRWKYGFRRNLHAKFNFLLRAPNLPYLKKPNSIKLKLRPYNYVLEEIEIRSSNPF